MVRAGSERTRKQRTNQLRSQFRPDDAICDTRGKQNIAGLKWPSAAAMKTRVHVMVRRRLVYKLHLFDNDLFVAPGPKMGQRSEPRHAAVYFVTPGPAQSDSAMPMRQNLLLES